MGLFRNRTPLETSLEPQDEDYREAVKKAQKMSTHSMIDWIDTSLIDVGKAIMDYRRHGDVSSLLELRYASVVMQALVDELIIREDNS